MSRLRLRAVLLAAGRGERLRPLTESVPKALVEVRGETLLERHLRALQRAGIHNTLVHAPLHGPASEETRTIRD